MCVFFSLTKCIVKCIIVLNRTIKKGRNNDILMFLYNNPQYNTAADIVKVRKSTKSHVSTSLKLLEDRGLVEKKQSEDNKKHVEIFLLDSAQEIVQAGLDVQKEFVNNMFQGLTAEEMVMCKRVFRKICNNAENHLKDR